MIHIPDINTFEKHVGELILRPNELVQITGVTTNGGSVVFDGVPYCLVLRHKNHAHYLSEVYMAPQGQWVKYPWQQYPGLWKYFRDLVQPLRTSLYLLKAESSKLTPEECIEQQANLVRCLPFLGEVFNSQR